MNQYTDPHAMNDEQRAVYRAGQFDELLAIANLLGPAAMLAELDAMPETAVREILVTCIARART